MSIVNSSFIISNESIDFHNQPMPIKIFSNVDEKFGKLSIKAAKTKKTTKSIFIKATMDVSGSMEEPSDNNRSRLDYVKQTLVKMLQFLSTSVESDIWIQIDAFSMEFSTIVQKILLTKDNVDTLIAKVNSMRAESMTNIELAFKESNKIMNSAILKNADYKTIHLFLTDGQPTSGETNIPSLVKLIDPDHSAIFIGYGTEHNSELLSKCSKRGIYNKYMFVDNFENTGLVYGEIVHALLYSAIEDVKITMNDGTLIYDAETNSWKQSLVVPALLSEKENIYHIKTIEPRYVECSIEGTICNQLDNENGDTIQITGENETLCIVDSLPDLVNEDGTILESNLSKYIFRQMTMELLYEAANNYTNTTHTDLKKRMKDFYKTMSMYIDENDLKEDTFMKILCEDIHISYMTLGSNEGNMYSESRNTSQRGQTCYRSGSATQHKPQPTLFRTNALFGRSISMPTNTMDYQRRAFYDDLSSDSDLNTEARIAPEVNDPHNIDNYNVDFITDDVYSSQTALGVIRNVSGVI